MCRKSAIMAKFGAEYGFGVESTFRDSSAVEQSPVDETLFGIIQLCQIREHMLIGAKPL